jgi:hypothetical protein
MDAVRVVATGDDDVICSRLLEWSGLTRVWHQYELDQDHNFITEIAAHCAGLSIDSEEWDGDYPGRSGEWYTISTSKPEEVIHELRALVAALLWKTRKTRRQQRISLNRLTRNGVTKRQRKPNGSTLLFVIERPGWDPFDVEREEFYLQISRSKSLESRIYRRISHHWDLLTRMPGVQVTPLDAVLELMKFEASALADPQTCVIKSPHIAKEELVALAKIIKDRPGKAS